MDNVLYRSTVVPANESADGETPSEIIVTQEANTVLVWHTGHDEGCMLLKNFDYSAHAAIEFAVDKARELRIARFGRRG